MMSDHLPRHEHVPTDSETECQRQTDSNKTMMEMTTISLEDDGNGGEGDNRADFGNIMTAQSVVENHSEGNDHQDCGNNNELCWDDVSFHSQEKDYNDKQRQEQTFATEEEEKQEKRLLKTITGWLKRDPKSSSSSDSSQHEIPSARETEMNSTLIPLEHTVDETLAEPKDSCETITRRNRFTPFLKWWAPAADENKENESLSQEHKREPQSDPYDELSGHSSDPAPEDDDDDNEDCDLGLMASALDWIGTNNDIADYESVCSEIASLASSAGSVGSFLEAAPPTRTPKQRKRDLRKIVQWMRKGKGKGQQREDKYDPTKEYRKLDHMLPKKNGTTPEARAREIEGALEWLREREEISIQESAEQKAVDLGKKYGPAPICITTPEERQEELQNVLNWLRNKGKGMKAVFDPSGNFRKLDKLLPKKRKQTLQSRAREIEGFMDWMRNSKLIPEGTTTLPEFEKLESFHISQRTPEQRTKDLENVMFWMCEDGVSDAIGDFSKLNLILEAKAGQSTQDRARQIECALDWLRHTQSENSLLPSRDSKSERSTGSVSRDRSPRRHRTPSPRRKRNRDVKIPKLIGVPLEEGPDLFASIGRVVHVVSPQPDDSTIETPNQIGLADIVQVSEITDAIALLIEPNSKEDVDAAVVADPDIFGGGNWWEPGSTE